ncbi:serine/threonine-protein kinase [Actinomadura macra]|uniref:serine/threonine-protein kinase n=1 Tax=Actinomadura macra TaxID=46164 RepID=UPI000836B965|nr:serine/threonine-protein kinase [Actinomadura macra]
MSDGEQADHADGRLLAGRYRLLSVVGRGGMGTVWRARDETLDRDVAVKEVVLHISLDAAERENRHRRTLREARASARLNHPGVVTVHDVVDEDDRPWIVMELVRARSLQDVVDEDGPLPPGRVASIGRQVVGALRAAHAIGILHRDVKPANVLVAADDRAVLTDFGIAQMAGDATLTNTGLILGSPAYMSPERLKGEPAIPASDLWALGATLYAACEGKAPHHRSDAMAVLAAVMTQEPPPPRNAGPLAPVLAGLLERDPVRRMSADQAEEALAAVASGHALSEAAAQIAQMAPPTPGNLATVSGGHWPTGTAVDDDVTRSSVPPVPMPDMTTHYPQAGHWTPGGPGTAGSPPAKRKPVLPVLLGVLVAAAIIVPLAVFLWPKDEARGGPATPTSPITQPGSSGPTSASPTRSPSGSPSGATPTQAPLPPGLVRAAGPGFTIGVPQGWKRTEQGNSTVWTDPASSAYVQVDRTQWTGDPYEHWVTWEQEAIADGKLQGFQRIEIAHTTVGALPAADIEFVWSRDGGTRARDRGVIAGGTPYAVVVAVPASTWNENEALVKNVLDTFRPNGVG